MSVIDNSLLLTAPAGGGSYQVSRSLRFNAGDSAYLSRTPGSSSNRKTWTWAGWVKRSELDGARQTLFWGSDSSVNSDQNTFELGILSNTLVLGGALSIFRQTTQVFRDASAWMHITVAVDTNNATANERMKIYVNGSLVTAFSIITNLTQGSDTGINQNTQHAISSIQPFSSSRYFSGYLADIHFIDGQALDPSSFTTTDLTTGQLVPKAYGGSYGSNGFKLSFSDNSTTAALGTDTSGNGNTWTVNNFSVTAGSGNDSLVDTPTSYGTDTGVGGEVRGNYATLNPLDNGSVILSNGNLDGSATVAWKSVRGTVAFPSSGKWYYEVTPGGSALLGVGIAAANKNLTDQSTGTFVGYNEDGRFYKDGSINASGKATYTSGDVIGVAFDCDTNSVTFYKNNVSQGSVTPSTGVSYFPFVQIYNSSYSANFGQRAFAYTAPSGFKALCDTNLPTPVVAKPNTVMDVALWTGNGAARSISGLGFSPDLVWIKARSTGSYRNALFDIVRGANNRLISDLTNAEDTGAGIGVVSAFNSNGFSLDGGGGTVNETSQTYVGWTWDAGTSTVTNTAGSITSQVRANASAGFSVVTYTATGSTLTVGHGLGAAPELIIIKGRTSTNSWAVYTKVVGTSGFLLLNSTAAVQNYNVWNNTSPTSTVFTVGAPFDEGNASGVNHVAYCFAPVSGYSNAFSYAGNGSSDGPMVWLGFKPRLIIYKRTDSTSNWSMYDTARDTYNITDRVLAPNSSAAEAQYASDIVDVLSNGFKIRSTGAAQNASGGTYIGFAFAESPFAYSRAR